MTGNPGCVLFVLQGSESMDRPARTAVRLHIDQALDHFLRHQRKRGPLDVGVIGYSRHGKRIAFTSLLPGVEHSTELVPLSQLKSGSRRQLRLDRLSFEGKVPPAEGLAYAHLILQRWLSDHPNARPPVVVHCGDRRGYRSNHARLSRSLRLMGSASGAIGLAHYILAPDRSLKFVGDSGRLLPPKLRPLWSHSSPVMLKRADGDPCAGRALAINADPLPLVRGLMRQVRPLQLKALSGRARMRVLSLARRDRTPDTSEDAVGCNASHGLVVLSDGAGSSVFAREWAHTLTDSFLTHKPDLGNAAEQAKWLHQCRQSWLRTIKFDQVPPAVHAMVEKTGAAATFLAWQLGTLSNGSLAWRAWAVGDSCLFWVRGSRLRATFPMVHSRNFASTPTLVSTWPQDPDPAPLFGAGMCSPGDLFILASDAVARYLLAAVEMGEEPDWNELELIQEDQWRVRIEALRDRGTLANDDCTLILARVQR